jgi:hypothetical protein
MNRFLDPYYFVNTLLLLVYGGLRAYFVYLTPEGSQHSRFKDLQDFSVWVSRCCAAGHGTLAAPKCRQQTDEIVLRNADAYPVFVAKQEKQVVLLVLASVAFKVRMHLV